MVSTETLQVIMDARDLLSSKVQQVNNALRQTGVAANAANSQAASSTSRVENAFDRLRNKVTTVWNTIKNTISSSNLGKGVSESALSQPFMNAAEKIRQKYTSMTQQVKSRLKEIRTNTIEIKGDNGDVIKKIRVTQTELNKIKQANVDPFKNISTAGLQTLNGQIVGLDAKLRATGTSASVCGNHIKTMSSSFTNLSGIGAAALSRLQSGFATLKTHITTAKDRISGLLGGISGLQSITSGIFGALGVSGLKSFIIDAGLAREKINAVTKSLVGNGAAFKQVESSIKSAIAGTTLGYNNMAQAINTVGIKYHMSAQQLANVPPVMAKVGLMAQAMGKSSEEAASIMEHSFDGLQGKWRTLSQTLGMSTKELQQALKDAGWSGASDDVDGYTRALERVLEKNPQLKEMMNSTEYKMEALKMAIKGVGTEIGVALLPYVKKVLEFIQSLQKNHPQLFKLAVVILVVVTALASLAMILLPIAMLFTAVGGTALLIVGALAAVAAGVYLAYTNFEQVRWVLDPVINAFKELGQALMDLMEGKISITDFLAKLVGALAQIPMIVPGALAGLAWAAFDGIVGQLESAAQGLYSWVAGLCSDFASWVSNGIAGILGSLGGVASSIWNWLTSTGNSILSWLGSGFSSIITGILDWISGIGSSLSSGGESLLTQIMTWLSTVFPSLLTSLAGIITSIGTWLLESGNSILEYLGTSFEGIMVYILEWLTGLGEQLSVWGQMLLDQILTWLTGLLPWLLEQLNLLWTNIITGLSMFFNSILLWLGEGFNWIMMSVLNFLMGVWNNFVMWGWNIVTGFIAQIMLLPGQFLTWLTNALNNARIWATQTINHFRQTATNTVNAFIAYIKSLPDKFKTWLNNTLDKAKQFAKDVYDKMKDAAKQAIDGFINKFKELPGKVWDWLMRVKDNIQNAVGSLVSAMRNLASQMLSAFTSAITGGFGSAEIINPIDEEIRQAIAGAEASDYADNKLGLGVSVNRSVDLMVHDRTVEKQYDTLEDLKELLIELLSLVGGDDSGASKNNNIVMLNLENADGQDMLNLLKEHITDKDILYSIADSREFQAFDKKKKTYLLNELSRHI